MSSIILVLAVLVLAFANGANDNYKGVATLFGSGRTDYRGALWWGTAATFAGSLAALLFAGTLLKSFSGQGVVADSVAARLDYAAAVALGAGLTVAFATRFGLPISTTHSLVGALIGAGMAAGSHIELDRVTTLFLLPLLLGPLLSLVTVLVVYPVLHTLRLRFGITEQSCYCIGTEASARLASGRCSVAVQAVPTVVVQQDTAENCRLQYGGRMLGVEIGRLSDATHFLSAGLVSFARGLNDTPKLAALLLLSPLVGPGGGMVVPALGIAIGGLVSARRVAETMSRKITSLNPGQGLVANVTTAIIVISASCCGLPVSTTHISCGALFGIGAVRGEARLATITGILTAWVVTLPLGAALAGLSYAAVQLLPAASFN